MGFYLWKLDFKEGLEDGLNFWHSGYDPIEKYVISSAEPAWHMCVTSIFSKQKTPDSECFLLLLIFIRKEYIERQA